MFGVERAEAEAILDGDRETAIALLLRIGELVEANQRLEARVALAKFLARFPDYTLAGEPVRGGRARFRGFLHLPARVAP